MRDFNAVVDLGELHFAVIPREIDCLADDCFSWSNDNILYIREFDIPQLNENVDDVKSIIELFLALLKNMIDLLIKTTSQPGDKHKVLAFA